MKVNLIFPGQGSQYVGMFNTFSESIFTNTFSEADEALGFSIKNLTLEGPEDKLKETEFTQPAIVTHSIACFRVLKEFLDKKDIKINSVLGHSVGEYSALCASGAIDFKDAVMAVNKRGSFMQSATPVGVGKMYAILRVPSDIVLKACTEVSSENYKVMPANYNEPGQTVISGHSEACDLAVEWLKNNFEGKQMAIPLKVSAPFHSSLMQPAEKKMNDYLTNLNIKSNDLDYIANIDSKKYQSATSEQIVANLTKQICGSVQWTQSLESFADDSIFIEVGPGKVLTGLNKKINKTFKTFTMDQEDSLSKLEIFLNECNI